jgi:hypothetical protein
MGLVSLAGLQPVDGDSPIAVADVNDQTNAIVNVINGNIDNDNIALLGVNRDKLAVEIQNMFLNGWNPITETHTRASETTITIPAGGLLKYAVSDKYKANQSIPLSAYWPMEDKDDDIIPATTANIGTPTYTAGKFNNALTLNGTDQALAITDATVFKPTGAFTLGMWVKSASAGANKWLFQSYSDNTNANGIRVYIDSANHISFDVGANAADAQNTLAGTTTLTNNAWHYVIVSSQGNHTKLFVDGVLEASGYTATPTYAATNYVRIGCAQVAGGANTAWMNGQIDDLFFINGHAVDQYWVAAKYAAATAQTTANITATYQGYVTAVTDTLLTLTGGADYALYNGTITSPHYSKASSPVGFPTEFNTATGKFYMNGRELIQYGYVTVTIASGNDSGTGSQLFLPLPYLDANYNISFSSPDTSIFATINEQPTSHVNTKTNASFYITLVTRSGNVAATRTAPTHWMTTGKI